MKSPRDKKNFYPLSSNTRTQKHCFVTVLLPEETTEIFAPQRDFSVEVFRFFGPRKRCQWGIDQICRDVICQTLNFNQVPKHQN